MTTPTAAAQRLAQQLRDRAKAQRMAGKPSAELLEQAARELEYLHARCVALEEKLTRNEGGR